MARIKQSKRRNHDAVAQGKGQLKRTLADIEGEIEAAVRQLDECQGRVKRLRAERNAHPDNATRRIQTAADSLQKLLPNYLFDALVVNPLPQYGALVSFDIAFKTNGRETMPGTGTYVDVLRVTVKFEKNTIFYWCEVDDGARAANFTLLWPKRSGRLTQQELWTKALACNNNDVGIAFVLLCVDAWERVYQCGNIDSDEIDLAALRETEVLRRLGQDGGRRSQYD